MTDYFSNFGAHCRVHISTVSIAALILSGCGGGAQRSDALSSPDTANSNLANETYEAPPTFKASDLLADDLLKGELHEISETVVNDGYENRYVIESEFGTFIAHRTDFVPERVQEVYAIAELGEVTQSDAFAQGVAQAATSPFRALKGLATEPVGTVTGAVRGIGALFSQAGEMVTGSRGELEDSAARELIGFGEIKREISKILDVDPYTTNQVLQDNMGEVAWAGFAGGLSLLPLTAQVGGGAGAALSGLQNSQTLNSLLTSQSPEALRDINRARLSEIGVEADVAETFVEQPWLSPRHETTITAALVGIDGAENHGAFLDQAVVSESEQQSVFLMRQAEATLGFHQNVAPIVRFERFDRQVLAFTDSGRVISILPVDHLVWSLSASLVADQAPNDGASRELWLTGSISPQARAAFEQRGWVVMAGESERLAPDLDAGLEDSEASAEEG